MINNFTTDYMRKTLYMMHSDDDWKKFVRKLTHYQVRQLFTSSMKRGQIKEYPNVKHENEQLDIEDVFGIKY